MLKEIMVSEGVILMTRIVATIVFLAHGIGHFLFWANSWGLWKTQDARAGLFNGIFSTSQTVEGMVGGLWLIPLLGFVLSAWGCYERSSWWRTTALISALLSAMFIGLWWNSLSLPSAVFALIVDAGITVALIWQHNGGLIHEA